MYEQSKVSSELLAKSLRGVVPEPKSIFLAELRLNGFNRMYLDIFEEEDSLEDREAQYQMLEPSLNTGTFVQLSDFQRLLELSISFEQLSVFFYFTQREPFPVGTVVPDEELANADLIIEYRDYSLLFISSAQESLILEIAGAIPAKGTLSNEKWPFGIW